MHYSKTEELLRYKFPYECSNFEQAEFFRDDNKKLDNNIHKVKKV